MRASVTDCVAYAMQTAAWMRRREKPHNFSTRKFLSHKSAARFNRSGVVTVLSANKWLWKNEAANLHSLMAIDEQKINIAQNLAGQK